MSIRAHDNDKGGAGDNAAAVLAALSAARTAADVADAQKLQYAVAWAAMHSAESITQTDWTPGNDGWSEKPVPVAGIGAPEVAEFAVPEFAAVLGLSPDSGRWYLGECVEVGYRLPRLYAKVVDGHLPAWKARRVAKHTISLPEAGARFVDRHVAPVAHTIGVAALDRLIEEARVRFDPEGAEAERRKATENRRLDVHADQVGFDGTVTVDGVLDLADALDLDEALRAGAAELADLGSTESLDVRRAQAAGLLARRDLTLDLTTGDSEPATSKTSRRAVRPRRLVLHAHLADAAVAGTATGLPLVRVEETGGFLTLDQLKTWCADPDTQITLKPVLDLAETWAVDAYEIPDRMNEQVTLRDKRCVHPWCTRRARRCDKDHCRAHRKNRKGGPTSPQNLAPLCRRHHRCKTQTTWTYTFIDDGTYLWTSPHGYQFLVDHHGTLDVTPGRQHHVAARLVVLDQVHDQADDTSPPEP